MAQESNSSNAPAFDPSSGAGPLDLGIQNSAGGMSSADATSRAGVQPPMQSMAAEPQTPSANPQDIAALAARDRPIKHDPVGQSLITAAATGPVAALLGKGGEHLLVEGGLFVVEHPREAIALVRDVVDSGVKEAFDATEVAVGHSIKGSELVLEKSIEANEFALRHPDSLPTPSREAIELVGDAAHFTAEKTLHATEFVVDHSLMPTKHIVKTSLDASDVVLRHPGEALPPPLIDDLPPSRNSDDVGAKHHAEAFGVPAFSPDPGASSASDVSSSGDRSFDHASHHHQDMTVDPSFDPGVHHGQNMSVDPSLDPGVQHHQDMTIDPSFDPGVHHDQNMSVDTFLDTGVHRDQNMSIDPGFEHGVSLDVNMSVDPFLDAGVHHDQNMSIDHSLDVDPTLGVDPSSGGADGGGHHHVP